MMMFSAVYYPAGCDTEVPEHYCSDCDVLEHARVRSVAFIKKSAAFTDPSDPTEWTTGITNGDIIIIPEVLGSFNGGDPVTGTGYGDQQERLTGYNFELLFKDPNYANNAAFYNAIKKSRNYLVAYRTETQIHVSENTVQVIPKNPVTENLTDEVVWDVAVRFSQGDLPEPVDTPEGVFDQCFQYS